jgi:hypothetical protein
MSIATSYAQAKEYATSLADRLVRVELMEFFTSVRDQFYPDKDVTFMEYFLSIAKREGEFVVHHSKLREYGVMTSEQSTHVKVKLRDLGLFEDRDYQVTDVCELRPQSGSSISKHYHLTPDAFKTCLVRALRRPGQPIDPKIYSDYYVLVEKIFGLYRDYQVAYQEKVISMKDDKIDTLLKEVAEQKLMIGEQRKEVAEQTKLIVIQSKENADQKEMIARQTQLLGFGKNSGGTNPAFVLPLMFIFCCFLSYLQMLLFFLVFLSYP